LGASVNDPVGNWSYHEAVLKNGRIYDAYTGSEGKPISEYLAQWQYPDAVKYTIVGKNGS
ncbi:MAG: hypothetical protein FWF75_09870, partial [Propionibacteriaceae bacterium]|nr:hypothetical protein [Propionibacteriaceae bacterium]